MAKKAKGIIRTVGEVQALKNQMGRPSKYDPRYIDMFLEYFGKPPYEVNPITGKTEANDFPTLAGFAVSIGIDRETLREWSKTYPEFSCAYNKASSFQEQYLAVNGLKGLIQQPMAIFTAKNVINWRDKKDVEITGNVTNLSDEDLERKLQEKLGKK